MATPAGKEVGTIKVIIGEVHIKGLDGVVRIAHVGDKVFANEVLMTSANAVVQVQLDNGNLLDLGRDSQIALDDDVTGGAGAAHAAAPAATAAAAGQDVAAIQAAIAAGQDPTQVAKATAAGGAPAAGGGPESGGAHTAVIVDQANMSQAVTSGFSTQGAGIGFPTTEAGPLLTTQQQPTISVSVNVAVNVEPTPGETPTPIDGTGQLGVNAANIIEGTDGGSRTVNFVISLNQAFASDVTVTYQIMPGPGDAQHAAQTPSDYIAPNGTTATVTIPAGQTTFTVPVQIVQDSTIENNENFSIVLTDATNATIDPNANSAVVTIVDDDLLAVSDTDWAQEDATNASGNVLQSIAHTGAPTGSFGDVADLDTAGDSVGLSVSAVNGVAANVGHAVAGTYGSLTLNADGSYTYALNNALPAVQALAQGQQVTESFNYTDVNGFGTTSTANLTVTIFGTNDAPVIHVSEGQGQGGVTEDVTLSAVGQLTSTDVDTGATAAWSVNGTNSSVYGTFSVDQSGKWTYMLNNGTDGVASPVQDLAAGQQINEQYTVRVTDEFGAHSDQVVTITINGTNDIPTITGGTGSVQEDGVPQPQQAAGTITFNDIDTQDVNNLTVNSNDGSNTWQSILEGTTGNVTVQGTYGFLTLDQNGNWVYTLNNSAANVQALAQGEQVHDIFPVSYSDTHGGVANNNIDITITGTDDAPVVGTGAATVSEEVLTTGNHDVVPDSDTSTDVTSVSGNISISDVDSSSSSIAVSLVAPPSNAITSGGQDLSWAGDGTGHLVGSINGGETQILDVTIDNSGHYTVTLLGPVDHATGNGENLFTYNFGVNVSDGILSTPTTLTVNIEDDTPVASPDTNSVTENGPLVATGNVLANDAIGADTPATVTWTGNTTAQYGTVVLNTDGSYQYTLDNSNSTVQGLSHGQHISETFNYTMTDADGDTSPSTLTVTINGVNEPPIITQFSNGAVTEDDTGDGIIPSTANPDTDGLVLKTSGTVSFTDADVTDMHTVSAQFVSTSYSGGELGALTAGLTTDTSSGTGGVVTWNYSLDDAKVDFLAAGQTITETYQVAVDDGNGGVASQNITITINGTNEAPVITIGEGDSATGTVTEDDTGNGVVPSTTNPDTDGLVLTTAGTLSFSDVDLSDSHSVQSVQFVSSSYNGGQLGGLTADVTTDTSNGTGGVVTWNYSLDDAKVDFLGANDSITETYKVTLEDGNGGTTTQDVTVTINGINEAPVITIGEGDSASGSVTEDNGTPSATNPDTDGVTLSASGTLSFSDVDLSDSHSVQSVQFLNSTYAGGQLGGLTADVTTDTSGGTGGVVGWNYSLDDAKVDFLGANDHITETYQVTLSDGNGGTTTQDVTVTINGTNEAPVVSDGTSVTVSEEVLTSPFTGNNDAGGADADSTNDVLIAHGSFNITDVDNNTWTVGLSSHNIQALTSGGQSIVWTGDGSSTLVGHAGSTTGTTIITITVDDSGNVAGTNGSGTAHYTVTLSGPLDHSSAGEDTISFNVRASVSDGTDTTSTQFTVNVEDDTPTVTVSAINESNVVLLTHDALTIGSAFDTSTSTANFGGVFSDNPSYGADGPGSTTMSYALSITAAPVNGLVDSGLSSAGNEIYLWNVGGVIVGSTATSVPATATDTSVVFSLSVDANAVVTLTQYQQIDHALPGDTSNYSTQVATLTDHLVSLTGTATTTDYDGDTATNSQTVDLGGNVQFADGGPSLSVDDLGLVYRTAGDNYGTYSFHVGPDSSIPFAIGSFDQSSMQWTNTFSGYNFGYESHTADSITYKATYQNSGTQTFFELTVKDDGTYDFHLVNPAPASPVDSGPLLQGLVGNQTGLSSYTFTADEFNGAFALVLTATANGSPATLTISSTDLGINGDSIQQQFGETLKLDVVQQPGYENTTVTDLQIGISSTGSLKTGDQFEINVHYADNTNSGSEVVNYDGSGTLNFNIDPTKVVDYVTFDAITKNANFKITGLELEYTATINPADNPLHFTLTGVDADGDSATSNFTVNLIAGTAGDDSLFTGPNADTVSGGAGNDTISAGGGDDILVGGQGNDILTGGLGNDTFQWLSGDQGTPGTPAIDTINDFHSAVGDNDKLDLASLLVNEAQGPLNTAGNLANYLHFSVSSGTTTLQVSTSGTFAVGDNATVAPLTGSEAVKVDQTIVFSSTDLVGAHTTQNDIINSLLAAAKLHTD